MLKELLELILFIYELGFLTLKEVLLLRQRSSSYNITDTVLLLLVFLVKLYTMETY